MRGSAVYGFMASVGTAAILGAGLLAGRGFSAHAAQVAAAPPRCQNIQVLIRPSTPLPAGAGHLGLWYRVHDLWGSPCTLQGYPGAEMLDRDFHTIPDPVGRGGYMIPNNLPRRQVVIDGHHDAYFALEYTDVPANNPCTKAPYMMFIPPNANLAVVTYSGGVLSCAPNHVDVSPVLPTRALR